MSDQDNGDNNNYAASDDHHASGADDRYERRDYGGEDGDRRDDRDNRGDDGDRRGGGGGDRRDYRDRRDDRGSRYDRDNRGGRRDDRGDRGDRPPKPRSKPGCTIYVSAREIGQENGIDEPALREVFEKYGNIESVFVARNPQGFAFISFDNEDSANKAIDEMNEQEIRGAVVRVELKREKREGEVRAGDWACSKCGTNNFARRDECFKCRTPRSRGYGGDRGGGGRGRRARSGERRRGGRRSRSRSRQRR